MTDSERREIESLLRRLRQEERDDNGHSAIYDALAFLLKRAIDGEEPKR